MYLWQQAPARSKHLGCPHLCQQLMQARQVGIPAGLSLC